MLLAAASAMATSVSGVLDTSSQTPATVSTGAIYFGSNHAATGTNAININDGSGDFSSTSSGWFRNLVGPGGPHGAPVSGPVNVPDFAEFTTAKGTVQVNLNFIPAGVGTNGGCMSDALGSECTPIIDGVKSPFTLIQGPTNTVAILFTFDGTAFYPPPSTGTSGLVDVTTTQVTDGTITSVLAAVESTAGLTFNHSWSATLTATPTAVPEPASLFLIGAGLLGAGVIARKRVKA